MKVRFIRRRWFQIFLGGVLLFILTDQALRITNNPNFFPTVILLGAFVIPVTFITYFYEYVRDRDISQPLLTTTFLVGGVLGLAAAGLLEFGTLQSLSIPGLFGVGLIEESAKLIFPVAMYAGWRYQHEADGLLFGIAAGMGFAAFETMGYGLTTLIQSGGNVGVLEQVLFFRGFLSPAGHAAWTGFICAILWHERQKKGHITVNFNVIGAFIIAVILHSLWNIISSIGRLVPALTFIALIGNIVVAAIGLTLVSWRFREARSPL